jgi:hypothetical protein
MNQETVVTEQASERNYRTDALLFIYKPVRWEGEEEKVSRAKRYLRIIEFLKNKCKNYELRRIDDIVNEVGYDCLSFEQQSRKHFLLNKLIVPVSICADLHDVKADDIDLISKILEKDNKNINLDQYGFIRSFYDKLEIFYKEILKMDGVLEIINN